MAIAHRATGAVGFSAGAPAAAIPAGTTTGDMMILLRAGKSTAYPWTMPAITNWTQVGQGASGTTVAGIDSGSMQIGVWYREWQSGDTDPTVAASTANTNGAAIISFSKAAGETWDTPVAVFGGDENVASTAFSVTMGSDPGVTAGDAVIILSGCNSDAATPFSSHLTFTQTGITPTVTHDFLTAAADSETTLGGDMGMCGGRATVTGTSSAAPVVSGTQAGASIGEGVFVRLRVTAAAPGPEQGDNRRRLQQLYVGMAS